ncbi:Hypothetical protein A7982_10195 [Minicystis rosea]|nr:Hypothetical protein A7982_10195 [Minicystis rosea]
MIGGVEDSSFNTGHSPGDRFILSRRGPLDQGRTGESSLIVGELSS